MGNCWFFFFILYATIVCQQVFPGRQHFRHQRQRAVPHEQRSAPHLGNNHDLRSYTCYQPADGLSQPVITIVSTVGGDYDPRVLEAVQNNRISYAMASRYRYCELQVKADSNRDWSWQRFPISLAILPCTDFLVYMDADALFVNPAYNFDDYYQYMEKTDIDILLSRDYFAMSPVQFGVYMIRNVDWIYQMFEELYNLCLCDWERMNNWPREQGMIYDYINMKMWMDEKFRKDNRTRIISWSGWNTQANQIAPKLLSHRFIQHYAGCCYNQSIQDFEYEKRWNITLANLKEFNFHNYVYPEEKVVKKHNFCLNIFQKNFTVMNQYSLVGSYSYYFQSLLNLQVNRDNELVFLELNQVVCPHNSHPACKLPIFYDQQQEGNLNHTELNIKYGNIQDLLAEMVV